MSQNRSTAVMQSRREPKDSLDDFPTPPWATRALCDWLTGQVSDPLWAFGCREPAANRGYMARALLEYFHFVEVSDVANYGTGWEIRDFLFPPAPASVGWTITNPPFRLAEDFIRVALGTSTQGVAMFLRFNFLEGQERFETLFSVTPPTDILLFSERVVLNRGKIVNPNIAVSVTDDVTGKVTRKKPASATAFCWLVWNKQRIAPPHPDFHWIPPCRNRLELPGDYDFPVVLP